MARGFERPPTWALIVMTAGVVVLAVLISFGMNRGKLSQAEVDRLNAAARDASANPSEAAQPVKVEPGNGGVINALLFGDSYSEGAGADDPEAEGYARQLAELLGWSIEVHSLSGVGYVNPGVDGSGPLSRLIDSLDLAAAAPDVVIVQGGHNDQGQGPNVMRDAVDEALGGIRAVLPDTPIIVVGLLYPSASPPAELVDVPREAIAATATGRPGVVYIDAATWTYPTVSDGIHPTTDGHRYIAEQLATAIREAELVSG